ncbi:DUF7507 domain-containing protein [Cellulosimicrobium arenosum]|uniref:DUF11 domain-containing protein n=1 Tax=Cellulosimicrobium arenosum TaxID=2708133 RepID=A0A927G851_9MICO|nr:DUF11 domain-containing protein [Cellulosimicrobium arenosum]MBD8078319.1 DUF11 domain-containing protein [Cellulosimicrobium arenosum]
MAKSSRRGHARLALTTVLMLAAAMVAAPAAAADFPIDEPFDGPTPNDAAWVPFGEASLTDEGDGWLQLTDTDTATGFGGYVLDSAFPTDLGVEIEFEYATWGGQELGGNRGDGFSFFLMDGSFPAAVGGDGGSLGYTFLQGGYAGVGFDEFGNYSAGLGGPGQQPGYISVRGSYSATPTWGYLTGVPGPGGTVETVPTGGGEPGREFVRTVRVIVTPAPSTDLIGVWSDSGPGTAIEPLIERFDIGNAPGQPALPDTFKLGFAASTGGATNNHEIRNLRVVVPTRLGIEKTTTTPVVGSGAQVSYDLAVSNDYVNDVVGARLVDDVPGEITDVTWSCVLSTGEDCREPSGSGNAIDTLLDLEALESATITVTGTAPFVDAETVLTNDAEVIAPADREDLTENTSSVDVTVLPAPALVLTKELVTATPLRYGEEVDYTLDVVNDGQGTAEDVVVTDRIPAELDPATVSADGCDLSGQVLSCDLGTLAPGATWSTTLSGTLAGDAAACGRTDVVQTAEVTSTTPEEDLSDNVATVTSECVVPVDLAISKAGPATATVGDEVEYTIVVTNGGPAPAPGTTIADDVPTAIADVSWACTVSDGSACSPGEGTGAEVATTATIPAGGEATLVVRGAAAAAGDVVNRATLTACPDCVDADGTDDVAEVATSITGATPTPVPTPDPGTPDAPGGADGAEPSDGLAQTGSAMLASAVAGLLAVGLGAGLVLHAARARRRA